MSHKSKTEKLVEELDGYHKYWTPLVASTTAKINEEFQKGHGVEDPDLWSILDDWHEFNTKYVEARKKLKYEKMYKALRAKEPLLQPDVKVDKRKAKCQFFWICIAPSSEMPIDLFIEYTHAIFKRSMFTSSIYTFEQRGETTDDIHGFHVHGLCKRGKYAKSYVEGQIKKRFEGYLGHEDALYIQEITETLVPEKMSYLHGQKTDSKKEKVITDSIFRDIYQLQPIYFLRAN